MYGIPGSEFLLLSPPSMTALLGGHLGGLTLTRRASNPCCTRTLQRTTPMVTTVSWTSPFSPSIKTSNSMCPHCLSSHICSSTFILSFQKKNYSLPRCAGKFYINLKQARGIWGGNTTEKIPHKISCSSLACRTSSEFVMGGCQPTVGGDSPG